MLLGVDDTDSLSGGCTTHVAVQLALRLRERSGLALLGHPRLVRLNPTNPWKTRGNAALCLHLGLPRGESVKLGEWGGEPVQAFPDGEEVPPSEAVLDEAWDTVLDLTWREDGRTNPGLVLATNPPPSEWYEEALHTLVDVDSAEARLTAESVLHRAEGSHRGLVGASAAIAWPMERSTWELMAYREGDRWGTSRHIDPEPVRKLEGDFPGTFDSFDTDTGDMTMVPSSPCPVLFGIRGTDNEELVNALGTMAGEAPAGWVIYLTNQATDDHLSSRTIPEVRPYESVAVRGIVASVPRTIKGGHVLFDMSGGGHHLAVAAYEPTKGFRHTVRDLRPGDMVVACGSIRSEPRTLNLEKFKLVSLGSSEELVKVGNPKCPRCGKGMKSVGTGAGFRCARCGTRAGSEDARTESRQRDIPVGWCEVPTGARRHLARPLKLGVRPELDAMADHSGQ